MKAYKKSEPFISICLELETQEEVDKIYTILNHAAIIRSVDLSGSYEHLKPYISDNYMDYFNTLDKALVKTYGKE